MRRTRLVAAAVAALCLAAALSNTAAAQQPVTLDGSSTCTSAGTFLVTVNLQNNVGEAGDIVIVYEALAGVTEVASGPLTWNPDPVPANGSSTSTFEVPGTVTSVALQGHVAFTQMNAPIGLGLTLGPCTVPTSIAPTTAAPSTAAPTTSAAAPAAVQPAFTG